MKKNLNVKIILLVFTMKFNWKSFEKIFFLKDNDRISILVKTLHVNLVSIVK